MKKAIVILLVAVIVLALLLVGTFTLESFSPLRNFGMLNSLCSNAGMAIVDFDGGENECYDMRTLKFYKLNCEDSFNCFLEEDEDAINNAPETIKLALERRNLNQE